MTHSYFQEPHDYTGNIITVRVRVCPISSLHIPTLYLLHLRHLPMVRLLVFFFFSCHLDYRFSTSSSSLKRMTMTMVCVMSSKLTWQEILVPGNGSGNKISSFSPVTCPCQDQLKFVMYKTNVVVTVKMIIFLLSNSLKLWGKWLLFKWQMLGLL